MLTTIQEIEAFIRDFETCRLPKSQWTHHAHLLVGLWYLSHHSADEALSVVRQRIRAYNEAVGTANTYATGYHETLTCLFFRGIADHIAAHTCEPFPVSLALLLRSPIGTKDWPLNFYSRERLFSVMARRQWVEPDLAPNTAEERMEIRRDDLTGREIVELLHEHLRCMALVSPPESRHALNLDGLRKPDVTFWSLWIEQNLAGCGALKELDQQHAEVKSMRTAYAYQKKGVASRMLRHIIGEARRGGYRRLSLETGTMEYFEPARKLYASFGFTRCGPFGGYIDDPNSVFMTKEL